MYSAIYRDFRPDRFDQIVGQDHIVKVLKNQIAAGQTGHAYLFCGTRGTGKTTTARILAKALNCKAEDRSARPCCECENCREVREGTFMDVIEIDAASNNGVDSIRELRESVKYPPVKGRNKVYIIDEVHMLSPGAFNALLKTLEEPPENVVFILATTEPQKLPATILSRCMRLDFRRVSEEIIAENMRKICEARGIGAESAALALIAVNADGSVRDSLSILEQCISTGQDFISRADVAELLGTAGEEALIALTDSVIRGDISEALIQLDQMIRSGSDVKQLMKEWLSHLRNLLMAKYVAQPAGLLNMSAENAERVRRQSGEIEGNLLNYAIEELSKTISESRWSSQPRVLLEVCIVRLGSGTGETQEPVPVRPRKAAGTVKKTAAAASAPAGARRQSATAAGTDEVSSGRNRAAGMGSDPDQDLSGGLADAGLMSPETEMPAAAPKADVGQGRSEAGQNAAGGLSGDIDPAVSAAADTGGAAEAAQAAGAAQSAGVDPEELWNAAVRKAVGEKPMLIRIETKAHPVRIAGGALYIAADDEYTEKVLMEKGKDLLESKLEMYYGSRLVLRLEHGAAAPTAAAGSAEDAGAENIARQIEEKFHMKVDIE